VRGGDPLHNEFIVIRLDQPLPHPEDDEDEEDDDDD
jgi:hypothetical protein